MKNVLDDILTLSVAERMQLVEDIWDSIAATPEAVPVTDAQRKELARRKRAHQRNLAAAKPWKEVRAKFERRR
ncbi:MAG: addiction module protein [Candidatus Rokubacteria bacterium]|nr:addiction module protein [Candidatus Rokubacteria bacterium]